MDLLRQLIREKIRQETSKKFKWNEFLSIEDNDIVILRRYAQERLKCLGNSSRAAYLLTSHSVLKIATCLRGLKQNAFEVRNYERLKNLPVTKILKHEEGSEPSWLVCELVNPIETDEQFKKLTGRYVSDLVYDASDGIDLDNTFIKIAKECIDGGLYLDELAIPQQWGTNADGELRLLDYGYAQGVQYGLS
jgi:hypothetical protein